jgi:hypothetical protein
MTDREESPFASIPAGTDIARYFVEDCLRSFDGQGAEGIGLWRDGRAYSYAWLEAHVDHDLSQYFLLDIRTTTGEEPFGETRDYLYVATGVNVLNSVACEWHNQPINFSASFEEHMEHLRAGLTWFVSRVLGDTEADAAIEIQ